jgi:hypothetical protein
MYNEFREAGYRIFGLYGSNDDGGCECGNPHCKAAFKHPRFSNWQHVPVWSDEQMEAMEMSDQLATGYGVLVHRLLVVDVDARNGGVDSHKKLLEKIPEISGAGLVVATGSGGGSKHLYFSLETDIAMVQHLDDYPGVDFKSSGFVVGPGSMHSSGNRYEAVIGTPYDISPAPAALIDLLKKPDSYRASFDGEYRDVTEGEIADMLSFIDPDCDHETWIRCGMAIHHATQGAGFDVWDRWSHSSRGGKYPGVDALQRRWHSFGKSSNPVTIGTLDHYARSAGWQQPVTFESDIVMDETGDSLPFSIDGIDLLRPPGFVGEVAQWINDQCRYPREHFAAAAALVAVGNVAGLRYTDDRDEVSLNMFAFCVGGSATGKEAVQQAVAEIHRAAGIHIATHGSIKSEQEIVRNLIRNQAAYYIIDEIGILLSKIESARKRGGAAYLDGVIGQLMAAYSKATGFMLLTGDTKDTVRDALRSELAACRKAVAENEDPTGSYNRRIPGLERALDGIDNGLERPFLSMIGFTTPVTFDGLVTREQAENGFIGRSILVNERETNPKAKRGFKRKPMPDSMKNALMGLYSGGDYDSSVTRVEYYGERHSVATTDQAHRMLDDALTYFEDKAETYKAANGFEAVPRRGYEQVAKISTILAAPGGTRTAEHVRWAFALVDRDIEEKSRLAFVNDEGQDKGQQIKAAILSRIDVDHGETIGVLINRMRKYKAVDIRTAVETMVKDGMIIEKCGAYYASE